MKRVLLAFAMAATLTSAGSAQFFSGAPSKWGPNGNGTLDHEDDLRWVFFNDAKVVADEAKGVYRAIFSPTLRKEEGIKLTITGYMLTVERSTNSPHFVLTRRTTGCPFCPPNEPTEAMEVFATKPVPYTQSPITIEGTLHLVSESGQGLFYRLNGAHQL